MSEQRYVRSLYNLLIRDKNTPIDDVVDALFSENKKARPFNPEVTIDNLPENLPVCLAVRAQRLDILVFLMFRFHADVSFSFCMTMLPAVNSMDLIPLEKPQNISFHDFALIACCNNYDVCSQIMGIISGAAETIKNSVSVLPFIRQVSSGGVDQRVLQALLSGVTELAKDENGRTCLHITAMSCGASTDPHSPAIVMLEELAKVRKSLDEFDDYGLTALQYACRAGCLAAVRVLIAAGADVNKYWGNDSCTALHLAVAAQSVEVVHELLHAGAETKTDVFCDYVGDEQMMITGDPADVARAAGNFRLARYVADPLRSSLGVLLDGDPNADTAAALMFEPTPGEEIDGVCGVCMENTKLIPLGRCHHTFCKSCLAQWFNTGSNGITYPKCPHSTCNMPVSIYDIEAVLGKERAERLNQLLLQRSLAEMPDFRWCPRCSNGGFFQGPCVDAECTKCGYKFCTECQQESHPGMSCQNKCNIMVDERVGSIGTYNWIAQNTKPCPACGVPISRNGGCSHIRCSRCGYEFCWFCLGKYQGVYTFEQRCPCPKRKAGQKPPHPQPPQAESRPAPVEQSEASPVDHQPQSEASPVQPQTETQPPE